MRIKILLTAFIMFFVGCFSDPADEIINVTKTSGGGPRSTFRGPITYEPVVTENVSVRVGDIGWRKGSDGVWYGTGGLKPADKEAVEAIEAYMNK